MPVAQHFIWPFLLLAGAGAAHAPRAEPLPQAATPPPAVTRRKRCLFPEGPWATLQASTQAEGFPSPACVQRARALVAQMTLAEKAGQMMQPDRGVLRAGDLQGRAFGSLLSGGGSTPADIGDARYDPLYPCGYGLTLQVAP